MAEKECNSVDLIWEEYYNLLLIFILKRVSDKAIAEDILQNVFTKIISKINSLKDSTKLKSWIFQITRNTIIDHYRESSTSAELPQDLQEEDDDLKNDINEEVESWISPFIQRLPDKYQEALLLTEIEGMSQKDLAIHLGISYAGAKSRVQRGRALLKEKLTQCCTFHADKYGNIMDYNPNASSCNFFDN